MDEDVLEAQLRWRSRRRGMLELDLLLGDFFEARWRDMSAEDRDTFVKLLDEQDGDLWGWFSGPTKPDDAALADMVRRILERVQPD